MIQGIIFDVDNTLIDFYQFKEKSCEAAVEAMIKAGLALDKKEALKRIYDLFEKHGLEYKNVFDDFLREVEGTLDYKKLARGILAYRNTRAYYLTPYPNVVATLAALKKKGLKMGVVSDAPRLKAWMRLCNMNIEDYFGFVVTFDDTGMRKPAPEPFQEALKHMNLRPQEILMIGDNSERDIEGAKKMGFLTAFAAYGSKDKSSKADYTLARFDDILIII